MRPYAGAYISPELRVAHHEVNGLVRPVTVLAVFFSFRRILTKKNVLCNESGDFEFTLFFRGVLATNIQIVINHVLQS